MNDDDIFAPGDDEILKDGGHYFIPWSATHGSVIVITAGRLVGHLSVTTAGALRMRWFAPPHVDEALAELNLTNYAKEPG